jgi:hypothetical protein
VPITAPSFRAAILVELIIKGYTESFLNTFLVFLKQRFFKGFVKWGLNSTVFNKYTLLRSSFVNKSSREQVEKRVYTRTLHLVFSEFDFKIFYSNLNSLSFKGVSLKFFKHYLLDNTYKKNWALVFIKTKTPLNFHSFWSSTSLSKKVFFLKNLLKINIHKVLLIIGKNRNFSKFLRKKFLIKMSFRKHRLKKAHFRKRPRVFHKKFYRKFRKGRVQRQRRKRKSRRKRRLKIGFFKVFYRKPAFSPKNELSISKFSSILLLYSYCFNNTLKFKVDSLKIDPVFSIKEQKMLSIKKHLLSSIVRYRKFFIWSFFDNIYQNVYLGGLSRTNLIDKYSIYFKLILGLKISPVDIDCRRSFFRGALGRRGNFLYSKKKNFMNFLSLIKVVGLNPLLVFSSRKVITTFYDKSLKLNWLFKLFRKKLSLKHQLVLTPWFIRRHFMRRFFKEKRRLQIKFKVPGLSPKKKAQLNKMTYYNNRLKRFHCRKLEYNKEVMFFNSSRYFERWPPFLFVAKYVALIVRKSTAKKNKIRFEKRLPWYVKKYWGTLWRIKHYNAYFKKKKSFVSWRRHRNAISYRLKKKLKKQARWKNKPKKKKKRFKFLLKKVRLYKQRTKRSLKPVFKKKLKKGSQTWLNKDFKRRRCLRLFRFTP